MDLGMMTSPNPWLTFGISAVALSVSAGSLYMAFRSDERANRPPTPNMEWYFDRKSNDEIQVTTVISGYSGQLEIKSIEVNDPPEAVLYSPQNYSAPQIARTGRDRALAASTRIVNINAEVPAFSTWRDAVSIVKRGAPDFPAQVNLQMTITIGFGNDAIEPIKLIVKRKLIGSS